MWMDLCIHDHFYPATRAAYYFKGVGKCLKKRMILLQCECVMSIVKKKLLKTWMRREKLAALKITVFFFKLQFFSWGITVFRNGGKQVCIWQTVPSPGDNLYKTEYINLFHSFKGVETKIQLFLDQLKPKHNCFNKTASVEKCCNMILTTRLEHLSNYSNIWPLHGLK